MYLRPSNRKGEAMKTLLECGHEESEHSEVTSGYGISQDGKKYCYACCAEIDKETMRKHGRITLYLTEKGITNWPASLVLPVHYKKEGRHNIAGKRFDVWFTFEDRQWHGVTYGDNTQLCHCRVVKN